MVQEDMQMTELKDTKRLESLGSPSSTIIDTTESGQAGQRLRSMLSNANLSILRLSDVHRSNAWEHLHNVSFVVGEWGGSRAKVFNTTSRLATVHQLPVLLFAERSLELQELEDVRLRGVSTVLTAETIEKSGTETLKELLGAPQWYTNSLERAPLPDALQMLATSRQSGMISISCPHCRPLSTRSWSELSSKCTGNDLCPGFAARIYMLRGNVSHTETGCSSGMDAFAHALALPSGVLRMSEVFIPPQRNNLEGSVSQLLISAATHLDELTREDARAERSSPPPLPSSPPTHPTPKSTIPSFSEAPGTQSREAKMSRCDKIIQKTKDLSLVVIADSDGGVHECAGDGDGDGLAAVGSITTQSLMRATEQLGLGEVESWTVAGAEKAICASVDAERSSFAVTTAPQNVFRQLDSFVKEVASTSGGQRHG